MGAFSGKILDALRSIAVSLQLSMLIPATLLVVGITWLIYPTLLTDDAVWVVAFLVITISYLLNAFNAPIIRLFEGYIGMDSVPFRVLRENQLRQFYRHHHRVYRYVKTINEIAMIEHEWEHDAKLTDQRAREIKRWQQALRDRAAHELERLELRYPPTPDRILPTGLGNTIAAWELYPERRYYLDGVNLWPRFAPVLLDKKYGTFVESEKDIFNFLLNLLLVSLIIWPGAFIAFALTGWPLAGLVFLLMPIFGYIVYRGTCIAAVNWGVTFKVAYDLYRLDLQKALKLKLPKRAKLSDERAMWRGISEFLVYGRLRNFKEFDYVTPNTESDRSSAKEQ